MENINDVPGIAKLVSQDSPIKMVSRILSEAMEERMKSVRDELYDLCNEERTRIASTLASVAIERNGLRTENAALRKALKVLVDWFDKEAVHGDSHDIQIEELREYVDPLRNTAGSGDMEEVQSERAKTT
jgi:hypothetical protein